MNPHTDNLPDQSIEVPDSFNGKLDSGKSKSYQHGDPRQSIDGAASRLSVGMSLPNIGLAAKSSNLVTQHQSHRDSAVEGDEDDMSIEKEVIAKAKTVIQRTGGDPYVQARELSKVKAELLRRRYGRETKLSEG